jgi:hypothetical protein
MEPTQPPIERRWQASRPGTPPPRPPGAYIGPVRLTPTRAMLAIALVGSGLFVLYGIVVRDATQVPMLVAGFGVLGIVFSALALGGAISTYGAAKEGRGGRAFALAVLGGIAAMIASGSFAVAVILALVWRA